MAKRFITTDLFKDAWFMDLPNKYKLFWIFLITDCNHSGIWQVNFKTAMFYVGEHLEPVECERIFRDRIIKIEKGKYWFIPKFIDFQYGYELRTSNKAVKKVIEKLKLYDLLKYLPKTKITEGASKELARSFEGAKEKEKEKEEDKEGVTLHNVTDLKNKFDEFRKKYPGVKRGLETEFQDFTKKHKDWKEVIPILLPSLESQIEVREVLRRKGEFVPNWQHLKTWLSQRSWEVEIGSESSSDVNYNQSITSFTRRLLEEVSNGK